ncbi:Putative uncharacterized protein [Moritella viscosa]|nr:Putative uncharacterized protein [Moritella viscosa]
MSVFGRTYVSCENGKVLVFIGIGSVGCCHIQVDGKSAT